MSANKLICKTCDVRIMPSRQDLRCDVCKEIKHYKCQKLTKNDVKIILSTCSSWTCFDCLSSILPLNTVESNPISPFRLKCPFCTGMSYSPNTVATCSGCGSVGHVKCIKGELGCPNFSNWI